MSLSKRITVAATTVLSLSATTAGVVGLSTGVAHAEGSTWGTVTADPSLTVRIAPSTHATSQTQLKKGTKVMVLCKTTGTSVAGTTTWYALSLGTGTGGYASAHYITASSIPTCTGPSATGKATTTLTMRQGPTTSDTAVGRIASGTKFTVVCKVTSQNVNGNSTWYWTSGHHWVSARYVSNVGTAPVRCN